MPFKPIDMCMCSGCRTNFEKGKIVNTVISEVFFLIGSDDCMWCGAIRVFVLVLRVFTNRNLAVSVLTKHARILDGLMPAKELL